MAMPPASSTPTRKPTSLASAATAAVIVIVIVVVVASSPLPSHVSASASPSPSRSRSWGTAASGVPPSSCPWWREGSSSSDSARGRLFGCGDGRGAASFRRIIGADAGPRGIGRGGGGGLRGLSRRARRDGREMVRQKMQELESAHRRKVREVRGAFRVKQRQFQNSMYALNSRFDDDFPRPPYSLWRLDPDTDAIGKTTLTGQIFLLNIAVFGLQTMYPRLTALGAKRSDMILEGRQLHRLLTPVFLHGGLGHLMANSYSLKSMGLNVERAFGRNRMLATYLASGIAGNVLSAVKSPNPAVGASGAIFGLVGAYYAFLARNQDLFGQKGEMQKSALIETIGINLLLGATNPMIDNWGHVGGFVGGVGMAYLIGPRLYVARVPIGGAGAGSVVIDRPTIAFRMPDAVDEGLNRMADGARSLGRRARGGLAGLFNGGGVGKDKVYYFDGIVDVKGMGGDARSGGGDGTIYRILKDDVQLGGGSVNVGPSDGFRQDVTEFDPTRIRQSGGGRKRGKTPREGRSIRPTYGHLYR